MKKVNMLLLFVTILSFSSCSKEEVNPYFFKCKIDGKEYSVANGIGAYATVYSSSINQVYGTESGDSKILSPRTMYISIEADKGVGTHAIKGKTLALFEDTDKSAYNTNFNNTLPEKGTLVITEKTATTMKGTFSFTAFTFTNPVKKITVTDGEFSVLFR